MFVAALRMLTSALVMMAPLGSVTIPVTVARSPWPNARQESNRAATVALRADDVILIPRVYDTLRLRNQTYRSGRRMPSINTGSTPGLTREARSLTSYPPWVYAMSVPM